MINLPDLAARLSAAGLMNKSFMDMTKSEIETLITAVFSSPSDHVPPDGWQSPYLETFDFGQRLVIPFGSHPDYHWWKRGHKLSVIDILVELNAPYEVAKMYMDDKTAVFLTEEDYLKRVGG